MKNYKWIYLGLVAYTMVLLYVYIMGLFTYEIFCQTTYSIADLIVNTLSPSIYIKIFTIPFLIGLLMNMKRYKNYNVILQYKKRIELIKSQVKFLFWWSSILAIVMIFVTLVVGVQMHKVFINWGSYASYFTIKTGSILPQASFGEVMLFGYILIVVKSVMLGLIITSFWWFADKMLFGITLVLSINVISWLNDTRLLHKPWLFLYGDYSFFVEPFNLLKGILWAVVFIGSMLFLQKIYVNKKVF